LGIALAVVVACLLTGLAIWLLSPGIGAAIDRMRMATDARTEAEAFEFAAKHTSRWMLLLQDKEGRQVSFREGWLEKDVAVLRISWGDVTYDHRLFEVKNVGILMRE